MIEITQTPRSPFDQAYGPNPITIGGIPTDPTTGIATAEKYVCQIWVNDTLVADLRQSPNENGVAIFDIQNVLQTFISPSRENIDSLGVSGAQLSNSAPESVAYVVRASYEQTGVVPPYPGEAGEWDETPILLDFGGAKEYFDVPYNPAAFIPSVAGTTCSYIVVSAQPFTERVPGRRAVDIALAGEGIPPFLATKTVRVIEQNVTVDDMTTHSFYNRPSVKTVSGPLTSIEAFVFYQYNGTTLISTTIVPNIQSNGGGPNLAVGDGANPTYPYAAITVATGPRNFEQFVNPLDIDPGTTHYYVVAQPWISGFCSIQKAAANIANETLFNPIRFNIVFPTCNDFPEYQFSWLNKYGFRDYYSFNKRKDRSITTNRNTYLKEAADYASTSYDVNVYNRGKTTYSQSLEENFTAFTDYISDADALFLEGLFTSADVRVRFDDTTWVPITITGTAYTEKTVRKDRLFQYDIKFRRAHNLKSQRG
jgi:hypothetical protein